MPSKTGDMTPDDKCPLCGSGGARPFCSAGKRSYFRCDICGGIFMAELDRLSRNEERARYLRHNNDILDQGYRNFVSPIVRSIAARQEVSDRGLDFGAGPGPVVAAMLRELNFSIALYDPFFHADTSVLKEQYDFIVCSEVMEHFYNPYAEFVTLRGLLGAGGHLFCTTHLYDETIDFRRWYYKDDPTHVFFYTEATIRWIQQNIGFAYSEIDHRLILFER